MPPEAVVQKWKAVYERGTIFVINRRANHSTMPMSVRVTQQKFRVFLPQEALGSDKPRPDDVTAEGIQEFHIIRPLAASNGVPDNTKRR